MRLLAIIAVVVLAGQTVSAQVPPGKTPPSPTAPTAPTAAAGSGSAEPVGPELAELRDERQLAEALAQIAQDPSVYVDNPKTRPLAQALMTEGVHQLRQGAYDQALANFLEAYTKLPNPRILLNIAATLKEMGRYADAANTYQRYLGDPASGTNQIGEVKDLLVKLDKDLTILTVRVMPHGSDLSIDGGPFVTVGSTLLTRVRPGIHLVRIKNGLGYDEVTVNGFDAEDKEVYTAVKMEVTDVARGSGSAAAPAGSGSGSATAVAAAGSGATPPATKPPPDHVDAWLDVGTLYTTTDPTSRERHVKTSSQGEVVAAIVPKYEVDDNNTLVMPSTEQVVHSGVLGMVRIDGQGHGFAAGLGIAYAASDHFELEIAGLKSSEYGAYAGGRYRFFLQQFRPYIGVGVPLFFYTLSDQNNVQTSHVSLGLRAAAGLELEINGHLSVEGDLGYEHFFFPDVNGATMAASKTTFAADVFVPTIGIIGRL